MPKIKVMKIGVLQICICFLTSGVLLLFPMRALGILFAAGKPLIPFEANRIASCREARQLAQYELDLRKIEALKLQGNVMGNRRETCIFGSRLQANSELPLNLSTRKKFVEYAREGQDIATIGLWLERWLIANPLDHEVRQILYEKALKDNDILAQKRHERILGKEKGTIEVLKLVVLIVLIGLITWQMVLLYKDITDYKDVSKNKENCSWPKNKKTRLG